MKKKICLFLAVLCVVQLVRTNEQPRTEPPVPSTDPCMPILPPKQGGL